MYMFFPGSVVFGDVVLFQYIMFMQEENDVCMITTLHRRTIITAILIVTIGSNDYGDEGKY